MPLRELLSGHLLLVPAFPRSLAADTHSALPGSQLPATAPANCAGTNRPLPLRRLLPPYGQGRAAIIGGMGCCTNPLATPEQGQVRNRDRDKQGNHRSHAGKHAISFPAATADSPTFIAAMSAFCLGVSGLS